MMRYDSYAVAEGGRNEKRCAEPTIRCRQENGFMQVWMCDEFPGPWKSGYADYLNVLETLRKSDHSQEIHVNISSPGGYTVALSDLATEIRSFRHVVTVVTGYAASCGFLLMALGDEIYVSPSATLVFHSASIALDGNTNVIDRESDFLKRIWAQNVDAYRLKRILTDEEIAEGYHTDIKFLGSELIARKAVFPYGMYLNRRHPKRIKAYCIGREIYAWCNGDYYIMRPVRNATDTNDVCLSWKGLVYLANPELHEFGIIGDQPPPEEEAMEEDAPRPERDEKPPQGEPCEQS